MFNESKIYAQSNLDFDGLLELKAKASRDDVETAREVGNQFEAMFVQMMLKSMREASEPLKTFYCRVHQLKYLHFARLVSDHLVPMHLLD